MQRSPAVATRQVPAKLSAPMQVWSFHLETVRISHRVLDCPLMPLELTDHLHEPNTLVKKNDIWILIFCGRIITHADEKVKLRIE